MKYPEFTIDIIHKDDKILAISLDTSEQPAELCVWVTNFEQRESDDSVQTRIKVSKKAL